MNKNIFRLSTVAAAVLGVSGCLGGGGSKDNDNSTGGGITGSSVFPSGLAVTSPTARASSSSARLGAAAMVSPAEAAVSGSHYQQATKLISDLLAGTADVKLVFNPI